MNENINLCEILKGHEGETFYNPLVGELKLKKVDDCVIHLEYRNSLIDIPYHGKDNDGFMVLFPTKNQRDWEKWDKENNHKTPKTWNELIKDKKYKECEAGIDKNGIEFAVTPIEKSALAFLKIFQLIEAGYGGNVTKEEWDKNNVCFVIRYDTIYKRFVVGGCVSNIQHIAFHTQAQAEEFLSKLENVQLLKDYFMI